MKVLTSFLIIWRACGEGIGRLLGIFITGRARRVVTWFGGNVLCVVVTGTCLVVSGLCVGVLNPCENRSLKFGSFWFVAAVVVVLCRFLNLLLPRVRFLSRLGRFLWRLRLVVVARVVVVVSGADKGCSVAGGATVDSSNREPNEFLSEENKEFASLSGVWLSNELRIFGKLRPNRDLKNLKSEMLNTTKKAIK